MTRTPPVTEPEAEEAWTIESARTLYNIEGWGIGYFDINEQGQSSFAPTQTILRANSIFSSWQMISRLRVSGYHSFCDSPTYSARESNR